MFGKLVYFVMSVVVALLLGNLVSMSVCFVCLVSQSMLQYVSGRRTVYIGYSRGTHCAASVDSQASQKGGLTCNHTYYI